MEQNLNNTTIIGEKTLSDYQIKMILPLFENMMNYLKVELDNKDDRKIQNSVHNVISILGPRGSGKSSIFKTAHDKIDPQEHIVFNPIVPEKVDKKVDLLGVILIQINNFLVEHDSMLKKYYSKESEKKEHFCIYSNEYEINKIFNKVFDTYNKKNDDFRTILKENYTSKNEYASAMKRILSAEIQLASDFKILIGEIIKIWKYETPSKSPKMIFMFDDADLNPQRANEVFDLLLKYLDHENIVTFIAADEKKLRENLCLHYYVDHEIIGNITGLSSVDFNITNSIDNYIYDLLKKVMPIPMRFSLKELSKDEKLKFSIMSNDVVTSDDDKSTIYFKDILKKKFSVLHDPKKDNLVDPFIDTVIDIFDKRPRGLMNIIYFLEKYDEELSVEFYSRFLDIMIDTNDIFEKRKSLIKDFIKIRELSEEESSGKKPSTKKILTSVNYTAISTQINTELRKNDLSDERKKEIQVYYLLLLKLSYFLEVVTGTTPKDTTLSKILNLLFASDTPENLYPRIKNKLELFSMNDFMTDLTGLGYQYLIINNNDLKEKLVKDMTAFENKIINNVAHNRVADYISEDEEWNTLFLSSTSSHDLQTLISEFENIEYNPSILQEVIETRNEKKNSKETEEIDLKIQMNTIGSHLKLTSNHITLALSYGSSLENEFISRILDFAVKYPSLIGLTRSDVNQPSDIESQPNKSNNLWNKLQDIKRQDNILNKLHLYYEKLSNQQQNIYYRGALTRAKNLIIKNTSTFHILGNMDISKNDFIEFVLDQLKSEKAININYLDDYEDTNQESDAFQDRKESISWMINKFLSNESKGIESAIWRFEGENNKQSVTMAARYLSGVFESYIIINEVIPKIELCRRELLKDFYKNLVNTYGPYLFNLLKSREGEMTNNDLSNLGGIIGDNLKEGDLSSHFTQIKLEELDPKTLGEMDKTPLLGLDYDFKKSFKKFEEFYKYNH